MDASQARAALMDGFPVFRDLAPDRRRIIEPLLTAVRLPEGTALFRKGDPGDTMYFLCRGRVAFFAEDNTGTPLFLEEVGPGGFFGEVALFDAQRRTTSATVTEEALALELHQEHIAPFLEDCPEAAYLVLQGMARRLSRSSQQLSRTYQSIEETLDKRRTRIERIADRWLPTFASPWFLLLNLFGIAVAYGFGLFGDNALDKLGLLLAVEALIVTTLVLNGQNRDERDMRIRDRILEERSAHIHEHLELLSIAVRALQSRRPTDRGE